MVHWSGYMLAPDSVGGDPPTEFLVELTNDMDRVRLWVDNVLKIDQWSSLGAGTNCTLCFASAAISNSELSRVDIQYKHEDGIPATLQTSLRNADGTISQIHASQYFPTTQGVCGSPIQIQVVPGFAKGVPARGDGLSFAAVSSTSTFTVISRDEYGNLRSATTDSFLVSSLLVNGSSESPTFLRSQSERQADAVFNVSYTGPTGAGLHSLRVSVLNQGMAYTLNPYH